MAIPSVGDRPRDAVRRAARSAVLLTAVTGVNAGGNLLVHVLVARTGGVGAYGAFGALLSLGVIAATLASGVQYAVARRSSLSSASPWVLIGDGAVAAAPWWTVILVAAAASPWIAGYVHVANALPVLLALAYCAALVAYAVPAGILVGRNRIGEFALLTSSATVMRILYGFAFGWGASDGRGALGSSALSVTSATGLAVFLLVRRPRRWGGSKVAASLRSRIVLTAEGAMGGVLSALLWATWSAPLLFSSHFLARSSSGAFAAAQLMVTVVLFLTAGVATAFFPLIIRTGRGREAIAGLVGTITLSSVSVMGLLLWGPWVATHLYGRPFTVGADLFASLGASVILVSALTYMLWASQAMQRHVGAVAIAIAGAVVTQLTMGELWHSSAFALGIGPAVSCAAGGAVAAAVIRLRGRERADGGAWVRLHVSAPSDAETRPGLLAETAVGIMVHNEAAMVEAVLRSVLAQHDGSSGVACVVVVASACTDGTDEIVRRIGTEDHRVRLLVEEERSGKASAVNWFLRQTTEPFCVLVGGDVLCVPGSLARLVAPLADPQVGMTGGRIVPTNERRGLVGRMVHILWELHHEVSLVRPKLGEATAFRRVIEHIDSNSLDEVSLEAAVIEAGYRLQYVPGCIVLNHGASTLGDYLAHRMRNHRGHLAVTRRTGYVPATSDRGLLVRLSLRRMLRHPLELMPLAAAVAIETIVRHEAWREHRLEIEGDDGVWRPLTSAKQTFEVEYQQLMEVRGRLAASPLPKAGGAKTR